MIPNAPVHPAIAASRAAMDAHIAQLVADAPVPPPHAQANPTPADVRSFPVYFIHGTGRHIASVTDCGHGYNLTDSCPICP